MVCNKACNPFYFPINLIILDTLKTLITRASYGPTLRNLRLMPFIKFIPISSNEANTTKKSNLFQSGIKYLDPKAIILSIHSIVKKNVNR